MRPQARILYAIGPGDVVDSYRKWRAGEEYPSETSRTYSGEFFEFCRRNGCLGYALSSCSKAEVLADGWMTVENRPKPRSGRGVRYHLSQTLYGFSIVSSAVRWRADTVVVDSGTTHWILLGLLKPFGIRVVGSLHNSVWPRGHKPTGRFKRFVLRTDGWFWRYLADGLLAVSPECERQVRELAGRFDAPVVQYLPQYRRSDFADIPPPSPIDRPPMCVLFAGRVERNKGVLDLVEAARLLEVRYPGRVCFDICGDGPALEELRSAIARLGLQGAVRVHGRLDRFELLHAYASTHVVIVPTRSDFIEGFARTFAEAVLCERPVVASAVVPAVETLGAAALVARPDDPESYAAAIGRLLESPERYERLRTACAGLRESFFDPRRGLSAALEQVLRPPAASA